MRAGIEQTIRRFEPRLAQVRVILVDSDNTQDATLRLRIEALLRVDPAPEPIVFDTLDRPRDGGGAGQSEFGRPSALSMSDALLPYYDRELNALRSLAAEFAATHPKIAGRLRLAPESVDDPHVARLLEGVAFLAARVHYRLDDEFPELTDALLGVLYPHYLAPFPSAAIAQFEATTGTHGAVTPRGGSGGGDRTGAGRDLPVPDRLAVDAVAGGDRECAAGRSTAARAGQSAGSGGCKRSAHYTEVPIGPGKFRPAGTGSPARCSCAGP